MSSLCILASGRRSAPTYCRTPSQASISGKARLELALCCVSVFGHPHASWLYRFHFSSFHQSMFIHPGSDARSSRN